MKTIQFNANNILNGNNYPIAYYYPIAKDLVIISTGHDDSIIDDSMGYSEYIIPILEAIQSTPLKQYDLHLASITSTVTDYKGTHTWVFSFNPKPYDQRDIDYIMGALSNIFDDDYFKPIITYAQGAFIVIQPYSC